jgi:hypothetical protein
MNTIKYIFIYIRNYYDIYSKNHIVIYKIGKIEMSNKKTQKIYLMYFNIFDPFLI